MDSTLTTMLFNVLTSNTTTLLSQHGGNGTPRNDKEAALDMAVESGQLEIAIQLLNDYITSKRALRLAAQHRNNGLVQQLFYKKHIKALETDGVSDTDRIAEIGDLSPLHIAALWGYTAIIDALLEAGVILKLVNTSGDTPFNLPAKGG